MDLNKLARICALVCQMEAVKANVVGMQADDRVRAEQGYALAWGSDMYFGAQDELETIAEELKKEGVVEPPSS